MKRFHGWICLVSLCALARVSCAVARNIRAVARVSCAVARNIRAVARQFRAYARDFSALARYLLGKTRGAARRGERAY